MLLLFSCLKCICICFDLFYFYSHCDFLVLWNHFLPGEREFNLVSVRAGNRPAVICFSLISEFVIFLSLHCRFLKDAPKSNSSQNVKTKKASSFLEFARSTNDAWDIDDEEDEDLLMGPMTSAPAPHSQPQVSTFLPSNPESDLEAHPSDTLGPLRTELCHDQQMTDGRSTNGRVVKSNSDAQLNTSSGMSGKNH